MKHENIDFLGRVTDEELVDLYSNALYTIFAFKHEPFGYIPVESMACGTPVLTYKKQGPSETVENMETGWLMNSDNEMLDFLKSNYESGITHSMRQKCVDSMKKYSVEKIAEKWMKYLDESN